MVRVILLLVMLATGTLMAQDNAEANVKQTIETFFEGFHKGDTLMMRSVMMGDFKTQTAYRNKEGKDILVTDDL